MSRDQYRPFYNNSWAIVIGINTYMSVGSLSYAIHDASAIQDILVSDLDFDKDKVFTIIDKEATRTNIMKVFSDIRNQASNPDDRLLFFFAGHGHTELGSRGPIGFLIPHEGDPSNLGSLLYFDDLIKTSELIQAKHVLFIMDVCYGGVILKRTVPPGSHRFLRSMLQRYSRQVITAGKSDEPVADGGGPGGNNSIFTGHLLEGLSGKASTNESILTANGLMQYTYDNVSKDPKSTQTPHFGYIDGDGDFIFNTPDKEHLNIESKSDFLVAIPAAITESTLLDPPKRQSFLDKSGYSNPEHPGFGKNIWTENLGEIRRATESKDVIHSAFSWISLISEPIDQFPDLVNIKEEIENGPITNPQNSSPYKEFHIPTYKQTTIDTAIWYEPFLNEFEYWKSYLRLDNKGNIEYSESHNVFIEFNGNRTFMYVTLVGLCWQFMFLVKNILETKEYKSGIKYSINIVGTKDTILSSFSENKGENGSVWSNPFKSGTLGSKPELLNLKCPNINLQLFYDFHLDKLDEENSKKIVIDIAEKLGLAFNHQSMPRCFNYNTYEFPWRQFFTYRTYR